MFEAKGPGGKSYRQIALEAFKDLQSGATVTYKQLADVMALSAKNDRSQIQQAVNQANKTLLKLYSRCVENIKNQGYKVIPANQHIMMAKTKESKAERQMNYA